MGTPPQILYDSIERPRLQALPILRGASLEAEIRKRAGAGWPP